MAIIATVMAPTPPENPLLEIPVKVTATAAKYKTQDYGPAKSLTLHFALQKIAQKSN